MSEEKRTTTVVWMPLECSSCERIYYEPVRKTTMLTLERAGVPPEETAAVIEKGLATGELACPRCKTAALN